ncbi:hypothetical protein B0H14DRAFT_2597337 [Mycena olivaceomarginata]|nr:hypothetical protein B0H14DRAFT_2597337 [Mycena olivaceomarginata]
MTKRHKTREKPVSIPTLEQSHPGGLCEGNQDLGSLSCLWGSGWSDCYSGWSSSSSSLSRVKSLLSAGAQVKTELVKTFMGFNVVPTAPPPPSPFAAPLFLGVYGTALWVAGASIYVWCTLRTGNTFSDILGWRTESRNQRSFQDPAEASEAGLSPHAGHYRLFRAPLLYESVYLSL